jgi:hypothetical protein
MNNKKCVLTGVIEEEEKIGIECVRTKESLLICIEGPKLLITFTSRGN